MATLMTTKVYLYASGIASCIWVCRKIVKVKLYIFTGYLMPSNGQQTKNWTELNLWVLHCLKWLLYYCLKFRRLIQFVWEARAVAMLQLPLTTNPVIKVSWQSFISLLHWKFFHLFENISAQILMLMTNLEGPQSQSTPTKLFSREKNGNGGFQKVQRLFSLFWRIRSKNILVLSSF